MAKPLITALVPPLYLGRMRVGQPAPQPVIGEAFYADPADAFQEWPDAVTAAQIANAFPVFGDTLVLTGASIADSNGVYVRIGPTQFDRGNGWRCNWIDEGAGVNYWIIVFGGTSVAYIGVTPGVFAEPWTVTFTVYLPPFGSPNPPVASQGSPSAGSGYGAFYVALDAHVFSDGTGFQFFIAMDLLPGMLTAQEPGYGLVNLGGTQPVGALWENPIGYGITPTVSHLVMAYGSDPAAGNSFGFALQDFLALYPDGIIWRVIGHKVQDPGDYYTFIIGLPSPEYLRPPDTWWDGR